MPQYLVKFKNGHIERLHAESKEQAREIAAKHYINPFPTGHVPTENEVKGAKTKISSVKKA